MSARDLEPAAPPFASKEGSAHCRIEPTERITWSGTEYNVPPFFYGRDNRAADVRWNVPLKRSQERLTVVRFEDTRF